MTHLFTWLPSVLLAVICAFCLLTMFSLFVSAKMGDEAMEQALGVSGKNTWVAPEPPIHEFRPHGGRRTTHTLFPGNGNDDKASSVDTETLA